MRSSVAVSRCSPSPVLTISAHGPGMPSSATPCHSRSADSKAAAAPAGSPGPTGLARRGQPSGEQLRVELARGQSQQVPAAAGLQHLPGRPGRPSRVEGRPQPGDVDVQRVHRPGGQLVAPDPVDQLVARDRLVRPRRQQPEDRPPLRRAQLELRFAAPSPHRPEHGHPHQRPAVNRSIASQAVVNQAVIGEPVVGSHGRHLPAGSTGI